ncbi:MAG TPA: HAMP domain-containing sensor histidine kinase [Acidimicrobiia bacterium]|nr:HAMP domain-containing sensor histidine kinase [Acidimicrobiia bacterium]
MTKARFAALLIAPVLLVVLAAVATSVVSLASLPEPTEPATEAGVARIGDDLALVIVTDPGDIVTGVRSVIADWGLLMPALVLAASASMAWLVAGKIKWEIDYARERVLEADDDRESRLQEVIHELRTPLAVMGTNLELAAMTTRGSSEADGYIEAALRAVGRMSRTVDDLAGHGRLAIDPEGAPVDLAAMAEEVVSEQAGPARAKGVHILKRGLDQVLVPSVDPAAVLTALGNFMSNAVRLAPTGSAIEVDWGVLDGWAWIAVSDEGPGLAPHHHARAFERGWQGAHDRDRGGGAGLGLTIARQVTEAQGGLVTLQAEEGGGATLALWLPLDADADAGSVVSSDQVHPLVSPWSVVPTTA